MSEALLDKKFEYWQNQLLDLGKRNRMINYRETKRATLKLVEPGFEELFRRVAVDEDELTFQSPIDKNSDIRTYSLLSLLETLSCPIPVNIGDIKTEGSILERQKTLKQLRSKSRLALDEQGTNILYMVYGFVEWREKNNASSVWIKSPLVLVPVSLILESLNAPYVLKKYENDVVVNPTLAYLFERDYGITLPSFDPEEQSINEFMDEMEKLVDRRGWRIVRDNSIGLVSFLKINMYKDLCNNEEGVKSNPIIRAFAGEKSTLSDIPEELYNYNHDSIPAMENYQVVNADSSQQDAILLSQKGISFVMQGPPGTGKSQTITNIIAQGLADGKRILFVSEKAAALEVVHKRLSEVHLDDFCLSLHSYKANKKDILEELGKSLELRPIKVKAEETAKLTELDTLKEFLAKYVSDIHEEKMPLEMSLYEVYGALVALEDTIELPLEIEFVEKMTKDQVNRLGLLVVDFDKAKSNLGDMWYKNPWNGTTIANVTYDLSNQIKDKLARVLYNLKSVLGDLEQIKVSEKDKAALMLKDLDTYLQLVSVSMECGNIPTSWIVNSVLVNEAKQLATALEEKKSLVIQNREILGEVFSSGFFKIDADSKVSRIKKLTEYIESELCLSDAAWTEYILQVKNEATYINGLYVSLDKMIHEINGLCDSLGIEHPSTVYELLARYKLHSILNAKYPVLEEWFDNDTEEVCQVINDYEDHCARLTELCDLIAQHCETKIIESINIAENASRFLSIKEINRFSQIRDFNFEALQNYVDESKKEYAGIKKIYYEIHDGISDKVDSILEIPDRIYDINRCVQILKLLVREVLPGDRWFDTSEDAHFEEYIGLCIEKRKKYELLKNEVEEHWDKDVYKLDYKALLNRFRVEYQGFFRVFKKSYRDDMKLLKGLYRSSAGSLKNTETVISMLERTEELAELEKWFVDNEILLQRLLGGKFCHISTDFVQIKEDRNAFKECYLLDGVGSKLLLYIDKYNRNDKNYFILAAELLEKLYAAIEAGKTKDVFQQSTISSALQMLSKDMDILQDALEMYANNRHLLLSPEKIVVAEYCKVMEQITEYQNLCESKVILEKTLRTVLGDKIGTEINNLQEFKQGLQAVEMVKKMFVNVPNTIRDIMVFQNDSISLEYTEELADKVVSDLDKKLQNIDVKSLVCEELQKRIESLLYNCEELQSESEGVIAFCKPSKENIDVMDCLEKLEIEQSCYRALSDNAANYINQFGSLYEGVNTNWSQVLLVMQKCILMNELACKLQWNKTQCENLLQSSSFGVSQENIENHAHDLLICEAEYKWICGLFDGTVKFLEMDLRKLFARWNNCLEQLATLDAWIDFRDCRKKCCEAGLEQFVLGAEDAYYKSGTLVNCFMKMFYLKWIEVNCAGTDAVAQFRARIQDSKIERYCELDAHQLPVAQMRIREKLISDMPNRNNFNRATDEMGILLHELNKKRKIMPLRKLFRTIPNLLLKLKPCLMMSPLSVSYFLEAETYKFDMVIFDEASQIFPQDAIGAICRGKQVVIAGDSKQLPPTSFFAASTNNLDGEYDSEEEEEEVIYDSILEEATNSLPNRSLLWHYRSRNEDLIAFSNQEIYKNKLTTFPSSNTVAADSGVEYVYVENGTYSGRCNIQEAKKCVELIKEHITKHPERSLGIIAFSEKQQATIEEAVHRFRESNPRYEKFFAEDREEPFFVKNLENVQGDERDTIIFSICYAKDPNGRMFMRFGPLGHQGGERRLNVAITRAKHNIKLVGSIMPYDIDLSKTKSEGIRMLKEYIEYAMKGSSVLRPYKNPNALYDTDEFCNGICKFLENKGYSVKQYVGSSEYKIDIAVEHPNYPGCYVAGIECDGNSYLMARTTRDREHLRKSILEQMGWKMYRVWSTEWINNKVGEQKRLLDFIADAIRTYKKGDDKAKISMPKQEDSVQVEVLQKKAEEPKKLRFPYYRMGDWRNAEYDYGKSNLQNLSARIRAVVEVEQPIHLDVLYRRLASAFGNEKATKPVRDTIDQALNRVIANEVVIEDGFVRFKTFTDIRARIPMGTQDRNIEYISKPEIADAMLTVIRNSLGIDRDALCAEVTSIFGYDRMGPKITKAMNDTIDYMLNKDMVIIMDGKMHIKEA